MRQSLCKIGAFVAHLVLFLPLAPAPAGAAEGRCALLSLEEAAEGLGFAVRPGVISPSGTSCQWAARERANAFVEVQVLNDPGTWAAPSLAPGFRRVKGIGTEAYVVPDSRGWAGGALIENRAIAIAISGGDTNAERATALLRLVAERLQ